MDPTATLSVGVDGRYTCRVRLRNGSTQEASCDDAIEWLKKHTVDVDSVARGDREWVPAAAALGMLENERRKRVLVYAHSEQESQARALCAIPGFERADVTWEHFETGWPNVHFLAGDAVVGRHACFLGSLYEPRQFLEQIAVCIALPRQLLRSFTMVFPFYGSGTSERVDKPGVLATAEPLATLFSTTMPLTREGPPRLVIYDIHALQEQFYFKDGICLNLTSGVPLLLERVRQDEATGLNTVVVFPDDGAHKRFKYLIGTLPYIVCDKVRDGEKRLVTLTESEVRKHKQGTRFIIIDDLVNSGGTLYEAYRAVRKAGGERVDAYVTHAIFPNDGWRNFLPDGKFAGFTQFYVTDTNPMVTNKLKDSAPFHVLPITQHLSNILMSLIE